MTTELQKTDMDMVEASLHNAKEKLAKMQQETQELEKQLKLARGTRDWTKEKTLDQKVEEILRNQVCTIRELGKLTGGSEDKIAKLVSSLGPTKVSNIGTIYQPRYTWKIGNEATAKERSAIILRLIQEVPLTTAELIEVTGIRLAFVSAALVEHQRNPDVRIVNVGGKWRHRWFVLGEGVKDAHLT